MLPDPLPLREHHLLLPSASSPAHTVQFYDPRFFPASSIADFFASGLQAGEGAFLIATPDHARLIKDCLELSGIDPHALERASRLVCLDAFATLETLRGNGPLTDEHFAPVFGPPIAHAINSSPSGRLRLFGEIVDLLANDGDYLACSQLERYWNNFRPPHSIRLYCAYSVAAFPDASSARFLCELCNLHDQVVPVIPTPGRQDWLGLLLERSHALQAEIHSRKTVENALRSMEFAYEQLFDAQVLQSLDLFENVPLPVMALEAPQFADLSADLCRSVQRSLRDILLACQQACVARRSAAEGGAEWHKSTGEILAYGKLTQVLCNLQDCVRVQNHH